MVLLIVKNMKSVRAEVLMLNNNSSDLTRRLESYKEQLLPLIHKHVPNCVVYLFGSRARGVYHEGADIDLALRAHDDSPIGQVLLFKIEDEFEDTTIPVLIDLLDFNAVSPKFRENILRDGVIWTRK